MKKSVIYFLIFFCLNGLVTAQVEGQKPATFKVEDIYFGAISFAQNYSYAGTDDFKLLAPSSTILNRDLSGYSNNHYFSGSVGNGFSAMVGFKGLNKKTNQYRTDRIYRLGIQATGIDVISQSLSKIDRVALDTLYSPITNSSYYIDSIYAHGINMTHSVSIAALDASVIFRTKPERRFKIYGGFGLVAGARLNATTAVFESRSKYIETYASNGDMVDETNRNYSDQNRETHRNKNGAYAAVYIPMGYTFRLGNKREFWKRLHIAGEFRPQILFTGLSELNSQVSSSLSTTGGFRYILGDVQQNQNYPIK